MIKNTLKLTCTFLMAVYISYVIDLHYQLIVYPYLKSMNYTYIISLFYIPRIYIGLVLGVKTADINDWIWNKKQPK